jgi:hypothetical protein
MRKKIAAVLTIAVFVLNSCAMADYLAEDVPVILYPPNTIIVTNNSYVSTLNHFKVVIFRRGGRVYVFEKDCDVVAGSSVSFTVGDFEIQSGDTARVGDLQLSWDM